MSEETKDVEWLKLCKKKDFVTFLTQKVAAGELDSVDIVLSITNEDEKNSLRMEFERWVAAGKPKAIMPATKDVPRITAIYRDRIFGKEKIFAYLSGNGSAVEGIKQIQLMLKRTDPNTGKEIQTNEPTGEIKREYTQDYSKDFAAKLLDRALKVAEHEQDVGLYIKSGRLKWMISKAELLEDYETVLARKMSTIQMKVPS